MSLRDPAIHWQPGVTLPSTRGSCGGFQQPHHPECRRSGDRMKKEWMDGCQLITLKHQMFFQPQQCSLYLLFSQNSEGSIMFILWERETHLLNGGIMAIVVHDDFCNVIDSPECVSYWRHWMANPNYFQSVWNLEITSLVVCVKTRGSFFFF